MQASLFPGEGQSYSSASSRRAISDQNFLKASQLFQESQRLLCCMQSCKHLLPSYIHRRGGFFSSSRLSWCCSYFFFFFLVPLSPCRLVPHHLTPHLGFFSCCLSAPVDGWMDGGTARSPLLIPPLEGQVGCTSALSSPLERSFSSFPVSKEEKEERGALQAAAVPALPSGKAKDLFSGQLPARGVECDTLSGAAVVRVTVHPFHTISLGDKKRVPFAYHFCLH